MAFLDNSGDIILDAVLTDTGRKRLAKGDGSFRITKFAFGDDEINYTLYDLNHASGSAYFDLNILQSPIFEAFTNNTSVMKSRLLTIARTDGLQAALDAKQASITGSATTIDTETLTSTRAMVTDANGKVAVSDVTSTELAILDGVTATTAELNILDGVTATATELNLIDGVTATLSLIHI